MEQGNNGSGNIQHEDNKVPLETLLLGTERERLPHVTPISHKYEHNEKKIILNLHQSEHQEKENVTPPQNEPGNVIQQALLDAMDIDWSLPMEERAIKRPDLPMKLKGLKEQDDVDQGRLGTSETHQPMAEEATDIYSTFIIHEKPTPGPGRTPNFTVTGK